MAATLAVMNSTIPRPFIQQDHNPTALLQLSLACKAAGDPLRLAILRLLGQGAFGVLELCHIFATKQSSMSHHLKVLAQAGLVSAQREGNSIFYRRPLLTEQDDWSQWLQATFATVDRCLMVDQDRIDNAVLDVMQERADACAEFFARHANDFKEQQDLIASIDQYGDALDALIASLTHHRSAHTALEIGPGEGAFLVTLARHFQQVVALDISSTLLSQAKSRCQQHSLKNIRFVHGDTLQLGESDNNRFDLVAANMVLHHVPAPRFIFQESARLLQPGGTLLITDLCRHEQTWAKESCGDLWLGFEPDDLTNWAHDAGLVESQSQFLGLRNGFQIQFRLFMKRLTNTHTIT